MKERTSEQLKGQIRSFAGKRKLQSQEVLQMFLLERVLDRISQSKYKDNFILKGGLLISSMIGITERTTMDMDTTVTGINMEETEIERIIREILLIDAGDEITLGAIRYSYRTILDDDEIGVMAYNTETIIAEKYETIIRRNIGTSRARDFYDLYMFYNLYKDSNNLDILKLAVARTAKKRESLGTMSEWEEIIEDMKEDKALKELWNNYCENNTYASEISFNEVIETTLHIAEMLGFH